MTLYSGGARACLSRRPALAPESLTYAAVKRKIPACSKRLGAPATGNRTGLARQHRAEVAELADALASGASGGNPVEVRVLFSAPIRKVPDRR